MDDKDTHYGGAAVTRKVGDQVFGAYTLTEKIKQDWGGENWVALEDDKHRSVMLTFLPDHIIFDPAALAEIENEVHLCSELDHPNLVRIYGIVMDETAAAVSMEHVEGISVSKLCADAPAGHLEVRAISAWINQLCGALSYVHRRQKCHHRWLSPAHLIITSKGTLKLAGLGLAKLSTSTAAKGHESDAHQATNSHQSPQQAHRRGPTASDDIYALGSTIYEILTSKPPFYEGDTPGKLSKEVPPAMMERRKQLGIVGKAIPPEWESNVAACLAKHAKDRPCSVAQFLEDLNLSSTGLPSPTLASEPKVTKHKVMVAAAVFLIVTIFAGSAWWIGGIVRSEFQRQAEIERIELEKRESEAAARAAAELAEKERLEQEAQAQAKAAEAEEARQLAIKQRQEEEKLKAEARGGVLVETEPAGANITLATEPVQKSPARFVSIKLGTHTITIEKKGFETIEKQVEVKEGVFTNLGTLKLSPETGQVSILSKPAGATVFVQGKKLGVTPLVLEKELTGIVSYQLKLDGYYPAQADGRVTVSDQLKLLVELEKRAGPSAGKVWQNDLGMEFKPVAGLNVLFGAVETRVKDFEWFVKETGYDAEKGMWSLKDSKWGQHGDSWKNPGFEQGEDHPVAGVSWTDAKAFCDWLTQRDRATGVLTADQYYRLPTDAEWSAAVRLREDDAATPEQKNGVATWQYPWGTQWPPPEEIGNYAGREIKLSGWPQGWKVIDQYRDDFARTSPTGSFSPRVYGLSDMGGNVWEWCEDRYKPSEVWRVLRGGSWSTNRKDHMLSSHREYYGPNDRYSMIGFRCVVSYL